MNPTVRRNKLFGLKMKSFSKNKNRKWKISTKEARD